MDEATRAWFDERFGRLADRIDRVCQDHIRYDKILKDHEMRIVRLERIPWLIGGVFVLLVPVALESLRNLLGF